MAPSRRTL